MISEWMVIRGKMVIRGWMVIRGSQVWHGHGKGMGMAWDDVGFASVMTGSGDGGRWAALLSRYVEIAGLGWTDGQTNGWMDDSRLATEHAGSMAAHNAQLTAHSSQLAARKSSLS